MRPALKLNQQCAFPGQLIEHLVIAQHGLWTSPAQTHESIALKIDPHFFQ
jgi:hypothetical protein